MPKSAFLFEGGPVFQNSGGMGPDDYLLRPIGTRQWVKVIFRFGRNFGVQIVDNQIVRPKDPIMPHTPESTSAQVVAKYDRMAMDYIFPIRDIHVGHNAANERRLRESGRLKVMSAEEYVRLYGLADDDD